MLKQQVRFFTKVSIIVDIIIILLAFFLSYWTINSITHRIDSLTVYIWALFILIPVLLYLLARTGLYASMRTKNHTEIIVQLLKVHAMGGITTTSCIYLFDPKWFSRFLLSGFFLFSFLLMSMFKCGLKLLLNFLRRRGYSLRHLLIVRSDDSGRHFIDLLTAHAEWGLVLSGDVRLCDKIDASANYSEECICVGDVEKLVNICKEKTIDEVVFAVERQMLSAVDTYLEAFQEMGITVRMVIDLYDAPFSHKELSMFHNNIPMLTYYSKTFDIEQLFLKRCLDITGSIVGLFITALFFPFVAIAIKSESKGPLFFGQIRVGRNGRTFRCWKFRSMFVDAEERKKDLVAHNEMQGAMFKMKDDPRVTVVGKFIRKTSIDELPQFWNVLCGEMSLVGTRPPTPDEVATYENWHRKRISIKPGITGLWQVSGRSQIQDFDEVVRLDIRYVETWTFWLDIKILFKTLWVVFAGRGAS